MLTRVAEYRFGPDHADDGGAFLTRLIASGVPSNEASYIVRRVIRSAKVGAESDHRFFQSVAGVFGFSLSMSALCMDPGCRFLRFYGVVDRNTALVLLSDCLKAAGADRLKEIYVEVEEGDDDMPLVLSDNHFVPVLTEQVIRMPLTGPISIGELPKGLVLMSLHECLTEPEYLDAAVQLVQDGYRAVPTCFPVGNIPADFIVGELRDTSVLQQCSYAGLIEGRVRALVLCVDRRSSGGKAATVDFTIVHESKRGQGIGIAVRSLALNALVSLGYRCVETLSAITNVRITSAYRATGGQFGEKIISYRRSVQTRSVGTEKLDM